jgi:hypothetical protein
MSAETAVLSSTLDLILCLTRPYYHTQMPDFVNWFAPISSIHQCHPNRIEGVELIRRKDDSEEPFHLLGRHLYS